MDGKRGAPIAANADQSVEWGVGGNVPPLVPEVSTRNGSNARGTQAGRVTPFFLVVSKDAPEPRPVQKADAGRIVAIPQVGGLHHRYERRAA